MATSSSPTIPDKSANKLWTPDFVFNLLTAHFLFASYTSLFTIIPPYVLDQGGQEWQIGVVVGSFGIAGFVIRPFAGRWINVLGARRVAIIGAIIFAVASLLYIPSFSVWWLVPVRMLQGIGLAMGPVATSTTVANLAPPRKLGAAMSYMSNTIAVSNLYAPVAGFWIITQFGFAPGFLFSAVAAVLSGVTAWMMSSPRPAAAVDRTAAKVPLVSRSAIFPTVVFLSYTFTTAPVNAFLPLLAEERNLGNPGLYFAVFSFTMMVVNNGDGQPRVLKLVEDGLVLAHRTWYSISNEGGWDGVADFEVQLLLQIGDANNDGTVTFADLARINGDCCGPADDDTPEARSDIN
ncbi:MAG: MFS transporter, partial [Chloroflexi bacterium]|nr:MFS transporter [Chloroflexota bacterium]